MIATNSSYAIDGLSLEEFLAAPSPKELEVAYVSKAMQEEATFNVSDPIRRVSGLLFRFDRKRAIVIFSGNIGAGKTSLAKEVERGMIAAGCGLIVRKKELSVGSPYQNSLTHLLLKRQYAVKDGEAGLGAFLFQHLILSQLAMVAEEADTYPASVTLLDRCLFDSRIFIDQMHRDGTLSGTEYATLRLILSNLLASYLRNCDILHVHLVTPPELCYESMTSRARAGEETLPLEYLTELHERHLEAYREPSYLHQSWPVTMLTLNAVDPITMKRIGVEELGRRVLAAMQSHYGERLPLKGNSLPGTGEW